MLLYTMTEGFLRDELIDGYSSAIWTERFFSSGDVEILCPLQKEFVDLLAPGTIVGHGSSREVAVIENHEIENGLLKVTGPMLDQALLKNRMAWFRNTETGEGASSTAEFKQTSTPGELIAVVVTDMVINPVDWTTWGVANLDWDRDKIENLTLGFISDGGLERPRTFPIGPLYDGLASFATSVGMGFRIFLESATDDDYSLIFTAWYGRDLTSRQDVNPLVRLSPNLNSLLETKEVLSISEYKNVAYVYFDNVIYTYYAEPDLPIPEGLDRRVMVRNAEGDPPPLEIAEYLAQHAADAFANNNYIRAIDGQASIPSKYRYQEDYRLGDIIELEGLTGNLAKARVTEYIRAQDENGDHEYPTVSVIDPLDSGNWPPVDDPDDWDPDPPWPPDPPDPVDPDPVDPDPPVYPKRKKKPHDYPPLITDPDPDPDPPPPPDPDPPDPDDPDDWPPTPDPEIWTPIDQYQWTWSGLMPTLAYPLDINPAIWTPQPIGILPLPFEGEEYRVVSIITGYIVCNTAGWEATGILLGVNAFQGDPEGAYGGFGIAGSEGFWPGSGGSVSPPSGLRQLNVTSHGGGFPGGFPHAGDWPVQVSANAYFYKPDPDSDPDDIGPDPQLFGQCTTRLYMRLD